MGKSAKDVSNQSRTHLGNLRRSSAASPKTPMMGSPGAREIERREIERRENERQIEMNNASERSGSSSPGVTRPSCNGLLQAPREPPAGQVHASL